MSTFDGMIHEFPNIRIDYFRTRPSTSPPVACFLSHIHSDHLQGLESLKSPFVYCSPATRRLLLRMEKYPHRINFAKGILEARKQTYKHLRLVLKALPLQTPTELELGPKEKIQITLFDANHCPGAVMFLIEGDGKAVLYTGDIRSETWWVNSIIRHPSLIPYTLGTKTLDCVYMDTTFAAKDDIYKEFPPKAVGLAELISKVEQYPPETTFYFRSWTLGYEDVWVALSAALGSRVHVDEYQARIYAGLAEDQRDGFSVVEAPPLVGFRAGNHLQSGCLTDDANARIHSCEPGTDCHATMVRKPNLVWIIPIISRLADGTEVLEIGAGGGGGDLYQISELDLTEPDVKQALQSLCTDIIQTPDLLTTAIEAIEKLSKTGDYTTSFAGLGLDLDVEVTLKNFIDHISKPSTTEPPPSATASKLTNTIHFPYSRHSSYSELRHLVSAFRPKDICPCTVDLETWSEEASIESLFGDLCSDKLFVHDAQTRLDAQEREDELAPSRRRKRKRLVNDDGETQREEGSNQRESNSFETAPDAGEIPDERATDSRAEHGYASDSPSTQLKAVRTAFHALNGGRDTISPSPPLASKSDVPAVAISATETDSADIDVLPTTEAASLSLSVDLERAPDPNPDPTSQLSVPLSAFLDSQSSSSQLDSTVPSARVEAYLAARACLVHGNSYAWDELGVRSLGYVGHEGEEFELWCE